MTRAKVTRRHVNPEALDRFVEERGFSSRWDFANYCGISWRTFNRMVDECSAPITVCFEIAKVFGVSFERIFGPDDSEEILLWRMCFDDENL